MDYELDLECVVTGAAAPHGWTLLSPNGETYSQSTKTYPSQNEAMRAAIAEKIRINRERQQKGFPD